MALPVKNTLQFITDKDGRCKYVENGVIKTSSPPVPLPQNAKGWMDTSIGFGTNKKYMNLLRSYTYPLFFVGDGAVICRNAIYKGAGYENELYFVSLRLNPQTGVYELEYKGRLDFGKASDEPRKGITVPTLEAGVLQYLANNDAVQYEIPLDITNTDCIQVLFDGVTLYDRLRYTIVPFAHVCGQDFWSVVTLPMPYISNEGDSVGVVFGSQSFDFLAKNILNTLSDVMLAYGTASANCIFYSIRPITVTITGTIKFTWTRDNYSDTPTGVYGFGVMFATNLRAAEPISTNPFTQYYNPTGSNPGGPVSINLNVSLTISLAANEKLYLLSIINDTIDRHATITYLESDLYYSFNTKNPPSKAWAITPLELWKELVHRMTEGRFTGDSAFFANNKNIVVTSTNALRNLSYNYYTGPFDTVDTAGVYTIVIPSTLANFPDGSQLIISGAASNNGGYTVLSTSFFTVGYTTITVLEPLASASLVGQISTVAAVKMSVEDFFNDYDCDYLLGLKAVDGVLWIEPIADLYSPTAELFDIGEITDLKIEYAYDMLCNTGSFGSKSQDYRQRNGRLEFNTTTHFKFPVDTLKKDYTKITRSRRDCFGIEFIRALIFDKPTTDTTGDNQAFMVDVVPGANYVYYQGGFEVYIDTGQYYIKIPQVLLQLTNGAQVVISGAASNNGTYTVENTSYLVVGFTIIRVTEPVTAALLNGEISTSDASLYSVNRPAYDSVTGVLDNTVYNTEITPHHQLLAHGRMLDSIMNLLPAEKIQFQTTDKNGDLTLTYPGGRILSQKQSEVISMLGTPLFYPLYANFKTKVPLTFNQVYQQMNAGYVKGTYIGVPLYFLPIGKMDSKPALNEPQVWQMILAATNDLNIINMLSLESDFTIDNMGNFLSVSKANALHFVRYNYALNPKYSHYQINQARQPSRNEDYIQRPYYLQKIQKTDPGIPVQVITNGISAVSADVYNADGTLYASYPMAITADPAIIAPVTRWDYTIDQSGFPEGVYCVVISTAAGNLRMSEWFHVAAVHAKTLLFECNHSTNKYGYYFSNVPSIPFRVEATLLAEYPDGTFVDYQDELADTELIDAIPVMKQELRIGNAYGVPDWVAMKMNMFLLMNQAYCEGKHISRTPESKLAKKSIVGSPLYSYLVEVTEAHPKYFDSTDETGTNEDVIFVATLDAQGFGLAPAGSVIEVDLTLNP